MNRNVCFHDLPQYAWTRRPNTSAPTATIATGNNLSQSLKKKKKINPPVLKQRARIMSFFLLTILCLMQPRILLALLEARTHCWLMLMFITTISGHWNLFHIWFCIFDLLPIVGCQASSHQWGYPAEAVMGIRSATLPSTSIYQSTQRLPHAHPTARHTLHSICLNHRDGFPVSHPETAKYRQSMN